MCLCQNTPGDAFRLIDDVVHLNSVLDSVYPDDGKQVVVTLTFFPMDILALHEREQRFTISGWFYVTWRDPHLTWNASDYGGIKKVYVAHKKIWKPDLTVNNGAEQLHNLDGSESSLVLSADGQVEWLPGSVYSASCEMDLAHFPFDSQDCSLAISTWVYTRDTVALAVRDPAFRRDSWHENSEWEVRNMSYELVNHTVTGKVYPFIVYHFSLQRRSTFYVLKFIMPIVILSLVNSFVFCVPAESGEKVSLAVSTMLSLTVFLAYLSDITPSNSDTVPSIALFVFLHLTLGACGVVCNMLLLRFHFNRMQSEQQSTYLKMMEKLLSTSSEEGSGSPSTAERQKQTTDTDSWTSYIDEDLSPFPYAFHYSFIRRGHGRRGTSLKSKIFSSMSGGDVPDNSRTLHRQLSSRGGRRARGFVDVTNDRYYTFEVDDADCRSKRQNESNINSNNNSNNNSPDGRRKDKATVLGRQTGSGGKCLKV
nr:hypothetical protein BaRGS_001604 [Batillaria attramentaria]